MSASPDLPERLGLQLRQESDKRKWAELRDAVARDRGVDPDTLSRPEIMVEAAETYVEHRQFAKLREDKRVREVVEHVADDHDVDPDDVSLVSAFKIAAGAYNGFELADDWELDQ